MLFYGVLLRIHGFENVNKVPIAAVIGAFGKELQHPSEGQDLSQEQAAFSTDYLKTLQPDSVMRRNSESHHLNAEKVTELKAGTEMEQAVVLNEESSMAFQETRIEKTEQCAAQKQKQYLFFQTVNHAKVLSDLKSKPKGILGGYLNIRSVIPKIDQIYTLLCDSNFV